MNDGLMTFLEELEHLNSCGLDCYVPEGEQAQTRADELMKSGHVREQQCVKCDGDGYAEDPDEQWVTGYELTELGRSVLGQAPTPHDEGESDA